MDTYYKICRICLPQHEERLRTITLTSQGLRMSENKTGRFSHLRPPNVLVPFAGLLFLGLLDLVPSVLSCFYGIQSSYFRAHISTLRNCFSSRSIRGLASGALGLHHRNSLRRLEPCYGIRNGTWNRDICHSCEHLRVHLHPTELSDRLHHLPLLHLRITFRMAQGQRPQASSNHPSIQYSCSHSNRRHPRRPYRRPSVRCNRVEASVECRNLSGHNHSLGSRFTE